MQLTKRDNASQRSPLNIIYNKSNKNGKFRTILGTILFPIGRKFTEIRPDYQDMETDSMVAALYWLELEMYNGGFLQFFCNWGYDAYLLAIKGLGAINATYTEQLLIQAYSIIQRLENDSQLQELWDIPKHLTENEITKLNKIDEEYWEDKENIMRLMLLKFHSDSVEI